MRISFIIYFYIFSCLNENYYNDCGVKSQEFQSNQNSKYQIKYDRGLVDVSCLLFMKNEFLSCILQTSLKKAVCLQTNPNKTVTQSGLLRHKSENENSFIIWLHWWHFSSYHGFWRVSILISSILWYNWP